MKTLLAVGTEHNALGPKNLAKASKDSAGKQESNRKI